MAARPMSRSGDADELLGEPVVVRLHARQVELRIGVGKEMAHHARRAEEHLGVDAVYVLLLEARRGAEIALVRRREGDAGPAHLLVLAPGRRVDADGRRRDVGANCQASPPSPSGTTRGTLSWNSSPCTSSTDAVAREHGNPRRSARYSRAMWRFTSSRAPYEQTIVRFKREGGSPAELPDDPGTAPRRRRAGRAVNRRCRRPTPAVGGHGDWRLPTGGSGGASNSPSIPVPAELRSLADHVCPSASDQWCAPAALGAVGGTYWTSTTPPNNDGRAMVNGLSPSSAVGVGFAESAFKTQSMRVRAVRDNP